MFVSDKCLVLVESLEEFYPEALWQRWAVHSYRNVWTAVPTSKVKEVAAMLKAIHVSIPVEKSPLCRSKIPHP